MTDDYRERLYAAYSSTHAGVADEKGGLLAFKRDILPRLPSSTSADIVDLGCGQGELVRQLNLHGYRGAWGIDISAEQVEMAHRAGVAAVEHGDFRTAFDRSSLDVVTATDFFEHLTKSEVLEAFDAVHTSLRPSGRLILRVPNSASPFGGHYRYGDVTHETSFTARSIRQFANAAGFDRVEVYACPPPVHGAKSLARRAVWAIASGAMKVALAAETGQLRRHVVTLNIVAVVHNPGPN